MLYAKEDAFTDVRFMLNKDQFNSIILSSNIDMTKSQDVSKEKVR